MKSPFRPATLAALLAALVLPLCGSTSAVAAADLARSGASISATARMGLSAAFAAAREFHPRDERSVYELGREDAVAAMRAADALVRSRAERLLASDIHSYFAAREACRDTATVNDYGTCEARAAERFGDRIVHSLGSSQGATSLARNTR